MSYKIVSTCIGCTACTKRCPTEAITGERNSIHIIDPELCIDCGACGVVCPVECINDDTGDVCKEFPRREWPKAIVIEENCIGSGRSFAWASSSFFPGLRLVFEHIAEGADGGTRATIRIDVEGPLAFLAWGAGGFYGRNFLDRSLGALRRMLEDEAPAVPEPEPAAEEPKPEAESEE